MNLKINRFRLLTIIFIFILYAYSLDYWGVNFPLSIASLFVIILFAWTFSKNKLSISNKTYLSIVLLFLICIINSLIRGFSVATLQEYLNMFYVPVFYYLFTNILNNEKYIKRFDKILEISFFINFVFFLLQQFVLGYAHQDNLCGMFGTVMGNDGFSNIFLCFYSCMILSRYIEKKVSISYVSTVLIISLYQAAISELKIYFIELVLIIIMLVVFTKPSIRKTKMVLGGCILLFCAYQGIQTLYPHFSGFLSAASIWENITNDSGYTMVGDINRFNGFGILIPILQSNKASVIFGVGIGNAIGNSAFYLNYSYLHYQWFAYAYIFVQTGLVGFVLYVLFYLNICTKNIKCVFTKQDIKGDVIASTICSVIAIVLLFYNLKNLTIMGGMLIAYYMSISEIKLRE